MPHEPASLPQSSPQPVHLPHHPIDPAHIAERLLATALPRRWTHVQAVAAQAERLASYLTSTTDRALLVAAAWLHDIGYAPDVSITGLHALDGARWLIARGHPAGLAGLVAHHSCAEYEARARGLTLDEFTCQQSAVTDLLWYADMTTGPDGELMTFDERLAEIRARYGPSHVVTHFWADAEPAMRAAITRAEAVLDASGVPATGA